MDYNQILSPGDVEKGLLNVVVEIPTGGIEKVEWDQNRHIMRIDRVDPIDFPTPVNYGFIPQTLNLDGDTLDVLVISSQRIPTSTILQAKIIGIMKFNDEGVSDDKIVVVPTEQKYGVDGIDFITDLSSRKIDEIMYFFSHYKDKLNISPTEVVGWGNITDAKTVINQSIERWNISKQK